MFQLKLINIYKHRTNSLKKSPKNIFFLVFLKKKDILLSELYMKQ